MAKLREAWKDLRRASSGQTSAGVDGVTVAQFGARVEANLAATLRQLREGYKFSDLRGVPVPKPNSSKKRIICIPTVQDRLVQRLVGEYLWARAAPLGIVNDVSFGFIRSSAEQPRGVEAARNRALALRRSHPWAYKSDIVAFFDRIERAPLVADTARSLRAPSLLPLLSSAVACEIDATDPSVMRISRENGIQQGLGVRQGMPLSPLFANIALRAFDQDVVRCGLRMVRYADDFIVLCNSREECESVNRTVSESLGRLNHTIPSLEEGGKTYIAAPDQPIDFLGLSIEPAGSRYELRITARQLEKIERDLNNLKDIGQLLSQGIDVGSLSRRIDARVAGLRAAYKIADNFSALESALSTSKPGIMRRVYSQAFGDEAVCAMRPQHKAFFGLA